VAADLIVVGASWGGLHALGTIVAALPVDFPLPVIIVQHRSRDSETLLEELLQDLTPLPVRQVDDKDPILGGHLYVAPADYHLLVDGEHFALTTDAPVRFSRPSIDVTFASAADHCGPCATGVVLTGANEDGSEGLRRIFDRGGRAMIQDPRGAEMPVMPSAALAAVPEATVLKLEDIGPALIRRVAELRQGGGQELGRGSRPAWRALSDSAPGDGWRPSRGLARPAPRARPGDGERGDPGPAR
jgi:two-component system chemotaxis response regulator CheB